MKSKVVAGKPPVGDENRGSAVGVPAGEAADGAELILYHPRLYDAIQISFAEDIEQKNE